jgi:uncharacterized membrane-anchored protein YjiN (DUF445 family)
VADVPENRALLGELLRDVLVHIAEDLDQPAVATLLEKAMRDQLSAYDLGPVIGKAIRRLLDEGALDEALKHASGGISRALQRTEMMAQMEVMLRQRLPEAAEQRHPVVGRPMLRGAEIVGVVDYTKLAIWLAGELARQAEAIAQDPINPLRKRIEVAITKAADGLTAGDEVSGAWVRQTTERLLHNTDLPHVIATILSRLKATALRDLASPDSAIASLLSHQVDRFVAELKSNQALRTQLDGWLKSSLSSVTRNHHHAIAEMVRSSLHPDKLPDKELVAQIEDKVGDDLQYIRLNGAVVGGIVGMAIALLRYLAG